MGSMASFEAPEPITNVTYDEAWDLAHEPTTRKIRDMAAAALKSVEFDVTLGEKTIEDLIVQLDNFASVMKGMNIVDDWCLIASISSEKSEVA